MREFRHLKPDHIKGLSWWFWTRENFAFMNNALDDIYGECISSYSHSWYNISEWAMLLFSIPLSYTLGIFIGPVYRRNDAMESALGDFPVIMYNKNTIAYFTVLEMLSGEKQ